MPETKSEEFDAAAPEEIIEQPVATPSPEETKPAPRVTINFEVWARLSGKRFDQLAGFRNWVKRQKIGPLTVLGWREAFQKFQNTPTN